MPYAQKPMMDDEEKQAQQQGGMNISGGAPANFSTGVPGQDAGGGAAKPQKSSGNYTNIQSYLEANKTQADQMGQTIADSVDQSAGQAQQKIQGLEAKTQKVEAYDPNEVFNNVTNLNDQQKNDYRTQRQTGGYTGPQTVDQVEGYADTQKATQEAATKLQNAQSETGQQQLLKDTYARPKYTAGENRLDQVLLQNSAGSKQALENVNDKYKGFNDLLGGATQKVGDSINAAKTQALSNKQNILKSEQDQYNNLLNPIQQRADQANKDNPALIQRIQADLEDDTLNAETLQRLGLSGNEKLYNQNLSGYMKPTETQVGIDNVASADERAKYKALSDLIQDPTKTQLSADGSAIDPLGFNKSAFLKDNAAKEKELADIFGKTNFSTESGNISIPYANSYAKGTANVNVADYLARGNNAFSLDSSQIGSGAGGSGSLGGGVGGGHYGYDQRQQGMQQAQASALQQLQDFLTQNNYYRTIQKG